MTSDEATVDPDHAEICASITRNGSIVQDCSQAQDAETDPLTASFEGMPETHDGNAFTFRLSLSEAIPTSQSALREHALDVENGSVTAAEQVNGQSDLWEITVTPENSASEISIRLPATSDCDSVGAICLTDGRQLTSDVSATVRANEIPFLAYFVPPTPDEHDGSSLFTLHLHLGKEAKVSYRKVRDQLLDVTGGTVTKAKRQTQGNNEDWTVTIRPDSEDEDVRVIVRTADSCDEAHAVCTAGGQLLEGDLRLTVDGPATLSVEDASVDESSGEDLEFVVSLSRRRFSETTVVFATSSETGDTATPRQDYTPANGTLTFAALETTKTIAVTILDDSVDEGEETLTLKLSNASGARLADAQAVGRIVNSDPVPRALLARFGRAVAVHMVEHVEDRMSAPRAPGFDGRFAGRRIAPGMEREMALEFVNRLNDSTGMNSSGNGFGNGTGSALAGSGGFRSHTPGSQAMNGGTSALGPGRMGGMGQTANTPGQRTGASGGGVLGRRQLSMGMNRKSLLTDSAFALNRQTDRGDTLSFWSRGAQSSFAGQEGALGVDGQVRTTMFGTDYAKGPMIVGLSVAHSRGLGGYNGTSGGRVASSVTGLYPWLGYKVSERLSVWGLTGYGAGSLLLSPEQGSVMETGLRMKMAAAGTRGELRAGGADGFGLAFKADMLWVGTSSQAVEGPGGRLAATSAAVNRTRTALEASRGFRLAGRVSLMPSMEVGVRHDAGDAEQGSGIDMGGGLVLTDPTSGLQIDVRVRTLLVHEAEGFREQGMSLSFGYNPTPQTPWGLTAQVTPSWGGQATSGADALWGRETMGGMGHGNFGAGNRIDGAIGYGLPLGNRFVGTPRIGFTTSEYSRDYRVGYALNALRTEGPTFELGVDAQRRISPLLDGTDNGFMGHATIGW